MFRRIELINHYPNWKPRESDAEFDPKWQQRDFIQGIMGASPEAVVDAWIDKLRGAQKSIPSNCRFYFTEKGWKEVGKFVVAACIKSKQEYRVLKIKETDAQIVWRDKHTGYEVAIQPKRKQQ